MNLCLYFFSFNIFGKKLCHIDVIFVQHVSWKGVTCETGNYFSAIVDENFLFSHFLKARICAKRRRDKRAIKSNYPTDYISQIYHRHIITKSIYSSGERDNKIFESVERKKGRQRRYGERRKWRAATDKGTPRVTAWGATNANRTKD